LVIFHSDDRTAAVASVDRDRQNLEAEPALERGEKTAHNNDALHALIRRLFYGHIAHENHFVSLSCAKRGSKSHFMTAQ
jgi:hypothetical protein